jgi:redox-sensitive bicupin YhaK (pirin superfamily)
MIEHRPFEALGRVEQDWLKARLHFAFAGMGRPEHSPLGALRVWNDDEFAPGSGFPLHGHADMEIVTYVRQGAITHEDSLGNIGRTEAGDVQVMSAASGIRHSEHNRGEVPTLLFQIWISPRESGGEPFWRNRRFPKADRSGRLVALASGFPEDREALPIRADARVLGASMLAGDQITYPMQRGRRAYLVVSSGRITLNGVHLDTRDGAVIRDEDHVVIAAPQDAELLLVDVA